jgi:hypothetical protein
MPLMAETAIHKITITGALDRRGQRLPGRFGARIDRGERLVHATATPLYHSASELLARGLAKATDTTAMRHSGSPHVILHAVVGAAARMVKDVPMPRAGASNAAGSCHTAGRNPAHGGGSQRHYERGERRRRQAYRWTSITAARSCWTSSAHRQHRLG